MSSISNRVKAAGAVRPILSLKIEQTKGQRVREMGEQEAER